MTGHTLAATTMADDHGRGTYTCACGSEGYASLSSQFYGEAALRAALRRNHDAHARRAA